MGGSSRESCAMRESVTQQRRVGEEGLRVVNPFQEGRRCGGEQPSVLTVPPEEAPANYVPAAAVIRRGQALSGIIGRKARAGGLLSLVSKCGAQPRDALETGRL